MTYEIYRTIFIVFTILAIVTFIVGIILFFALKIPKVVGDLTGINAKKAIENIKNQNAESADRVDDPSVGHSRRIAITDKITPSGALLRKNTGGDGGISTTKISTQKLMEENQKSYYASGGNETTVLSQAAMNETMVLSDLAGGSNETTILSNMPQGVGETTVLSEVQQPANETTILNEMPQEGNHTESLTPEMSPTYVQQTSHSNVQQAVFEIEFEITYIHTNEIIA